MTVDNSLFNNCSTGVVLALDSDVIFSFLKISNVSSLMNSLLTFEKSSIIMNDSIVWNIGNSTKNVFNLDEVEI